MRDPHAHGTMLHSIVSNEIVPREEQDRGMDHDLDASSPYVQCSDQAEADATEVPERLPER